MLYLLKCQRFLFTVVFMPEESSVSLEDQPHSTSRHSAADSDGAGDGSVSAADSSGRATVTERYWDGWPTKPTPENLIPRLGELPVSSTVHFQSVTMTEMGRGIPNSQLKELRLSLIVSARESPHRKWTVDQEGKVRVVTEHPEEVGRVDFPEDEIEGMTLALRADSEGFRQWARYWMMDASPRDRELYERARANLNEVKMAVERGEMRAERLHQEQRELVLMMGQLRQEREVRKRISESRMEQVRAGVAILTRSPVLSLDELVERLTDAGLIAWDIDIEGSRDGENVRDVLGRLFSILDEGRLDPLVAAHADAMDVPAEGVILYQEQGWYSRGISLGNLLHSVALAPGEVTQIAMTHWSHKTRATGSESDSQIDSTSEADTRDRAVSEVQDAASKEHTFGGTFASAFSSSEQGGFSGIFASGSMSANQSVSRSVSFNNGSKQLSMAANQRVNDTTHRHAEAARTRRATVVREVSQSEEQNLTTRVLANYNHMHALTMMYFEVIEVLDLRTRVIDAERVVFLPFAVREVRELIPHYRAVLARAARFVGRSDMADAILAYRPTDDDPKGTAALKRRIEELEPSGVDNVVAGEIAKANSHITSIRSSLEEIGTNAATSRAHYKLLLEELSGKRTATLNALNEVPSFLREMARQALRTELRPLDQEIQQINATIDNIGLQERRSRSRLMPELAHAERRLQRLHRELRSQKAALRVLEAMSGGHEHDPFHDLKLLFNQEVWLSLSPGEVLGLVKRRYSYKGEMLVGQVDPTPVAVTGNLVAYRWQFETSEKAQVFKRQYVHPFIGDPEQELATAKATIAIPTGGIFGEAVLGEAVAAEKIDLSRFWNWKDSMIPILPTGINPLNAATPQMQELDTKPTGLDPSSATLGPMQDLPAPSGFQVLGETMRAQIFRDMSGQDLVKSLAETSVRAASEGSQDAARVASENFKRGMDMLEKVAPQALAAVAAPETGGMSLAAAGEMAGGEGGMSLLGGIMNSGSGPLSNLQGGKGDFVEKAVESAVTGVTGGGDSTHEGLEVPEEDLEPKPNRT